MGVGWVGGALARYFQEAGLEPVLYDPPKGLGDAAALASADVIFVCLPTPYDEKAGGFDLSYVEAGLQTISGSKTVIIKSTVLPGTTEALQAKFPQHRLLFNPEFLRQAHADADMREPERQIMGYTEKSREVAAAMLELLPRAPFQKVIRATEAEMVKYFGNCFLALKVVFANQVFDVCSKLGLDYDLVKDCAAADTRIGSSHLKIAPDGYRGYGGGCFPKDVKAFIQLGDQVGAEQRLMKACDELNRELAALTKEKARV